MLRTVSEDPCQICGQLTNAYDQLAGRMCPKCLADHVVKCSGIPLVEANKHLLTDPLIDHNNDVDAHLVKRRKSKMGKKVRLEFEEIAGYPQLGTFRLWIDGKEITDGLMKGTYIKGYAANLPWTIKPF